MRSHCVRGSPVTSTGSNSVAVLKQDWRDCGRIPTIVPCGREN